MKILENCLILIEIVALILSFFISDTEIVSTFTGWLLIVLFSSAKLPRILNRYFKTHVFKSDFLLRFGIVLFPACMFTFLLLTPPFAYFFLPQSLRIFASLDISVAVIGVLTMVFISIFYFSWRIWRYPIVALKLWRKSCHSKEEFEWDLKQSSSSSIGSVLNKYMSPGVTPMALSVILFFGWIILSIFDVFMITFLFLWLIYNFMYEIRYRHAEFCERTKKAYQFFTNEDQILIWEALLRAGLRGNISGIMDVVTIIGGIFIIILTSLFSLEAFITMFVLLGAWYILIVLIQIARRAKFKADTHTLMILHTIPSLPAHVDAVLAGYFGIIIGFSIMTFQKIGYDPEVLLTFLICSIIMNIAALLSIVFWVNRKNRSLAYNKNWKSGLNKDRIRLYMLLFVLGLPIVLAEEKFSWLIFWIVFTGSIMLLSLFDIVKSKIQTKHPVTYATIITVHLATGVYVIIASAIYMLPELKLLLEFTTTIVGVLLVFTWIQTYRQRQQISLKRKNKVLHKDYNI